MTEEKQTLVTLTKEAVDTAIHDLDTHDYELCTLSEELYTSLGDTADFHALGRTLVDSMKDVIWYDSAAIISDALRISFEQQNNDLDKDICREQAHLISNQNNEWYVYKILDALKDEISNADNVWPSRERTHLQKVLLESLDQFIENITEALVQRSREVCGEVIFNNEDPRDGWFLNESDFCYRQEGRQDEERYICED